MNSLNNPLKLVFAWLVASIGVTLFVTLIAGLITSGGEQWPLKIVTKAMIVIPSVGLILSLVSPFFYKAWGKKYWYLMAFLAALLSIPLYIYFS